MFREFGHAPLCLELDFDSYEGPEHHVRRFRNQSGWLLMAEIVIQDQYDVLRERVIVACDDRERPIPSFKARHLAECRWTIRGECTELPPQLLDDMISEEVGDLIVRWHRQRSVALARVHEEQLARIAGIERTVQAAIGRNDARIADLRRRRRHPCATEQERNFMTAVIADLEAENDRALAEMVEARSAARRQAEEQEERLWPQEDLLVEVEPLHLVEWRGRQESGLHHDLRPSRTNFVPAQPRRVSDPVELRIQEMLRRSLPRLAPERVEPQKEPSAPAPSSSQEPPAPSDTEVQANADPPAGVNGSWTEGRLALLRQLWLEGVSATEIAGQLGGVTANRVIGKAYRIGLPKRETAAPVPTSSANPVRDTGQTLANPCQAEPAWTPERVALLERLWLKGLSARMIANIIGGCTRNAVIGKAQRLGLPMQAARADAKTSHEGRA